jgi:CRISPR/Cas system-associated protein Csm6
MNVCRRLHLGRIRKDIINMSPSECHPDGTDDSTCFVHACLPKLLVDEIKKMISDSTRTAAAMIDLRSLQMMTAKMWERDSEEIMKAFRLLTTTTRARSVQEPRCRQGTPAPGPHLFSPLPL